MRVFFFGTIRCKPKTQTVRPTSYQLWLQVCSSSAPTLPDEHHDKHPVVSEGFGETSKHTAKHGNLREPEKTNSFKTRTAPQSLSD